MYKAHFFFAIHTISFGSYKKIKRGFVQFISTTVSTKIEKGYLQQEYTVQCPLSHTYSAFLLPLDASTV